MNGTDTRGGSQLSKTWPGETRRLSKILLTFNTGQEFQRPKMSYCVRRFPPRPQVNLSSS